MFLIGLAFVGQGLNNLFYMQPLDRLYYLGLAFIPTFALCHMFHVMSRQTATLARKAVR
jgi:hypothetical protein